MAEVEQAAVGEPRLRLRSPWRKWIVLFVAAATLGVASGIAIPLVRFEHSLRAQRDLVGFQEEIASDAATLREALEAFAGANGGRFLARLEDLLAPGGYGPSWLPRAEARVDPWGASYRVAIRSGEIDGLFLEFGSYGSDGAPGGEGDAMDRTFPIETRPWLFCPD